MKTRKNSKRINMAKDVENAKNKASYTAVSLFSGMGGDTLGMTQAGCKVIAYNELKPTFCLSHDANYSDCVLIKEKEGGLHDISQLSDACFEAYRGKVDVLFAGFPCQGFSNAGKKKDDDPRNTLFREFLRFARFSQPNMIVGENVKGLLTKKTSDGRMYIDIIVEEFEKLGYDVIYNVFKTEKYGVPQKRERLIILGIKKDNPYGWTPRFPSAEQSVPDLRGILQYSMQGSIKVDDNLFDQLGIPKECILCDMNDTALYAENNGAHPYLVSKVNANIANRSYLGKQFEHVLSFGKRESPIHCEVIDVRTPAKTIICTYEHQPRFFVPIRNASGYYLRTLLVDELKQIQGFPSDYKVCGSIKEQIIQIGNAVPPPLIKKILEGVFIT